MPPDGKSPPKGKDKCQNRLSPYRRPAPRMQTRAICGRHTPCRLTAKTPAHTNRKNPRLPPSFAEQIHDIQHDNQNDDQRIKRQRGVNAPPCGPRPKRAYGFKRKQHSQPGQREKEGEQRDGRIGRVRCPALPVEPDAAMDSGPRLIDKRAAAFPTMLHCKYLPQVFVRSARKRRMPPHRRPARKTARSGRKTPVGGMRRACFGPYAHSLFVKQILLFAFAIFFGYITQLVVNHRRFCREAFPHPDFRFDKLNLCSRRK